MAVLYEYTYVDEIIMLYYKIKNDYKLKGYTHLCYSGRVLDLETNVSYDVVYVAIDEKLLPQVEINLQYQHLYPDFYDLRRFYTEVINYSNKYYSRRLSKDYLQGFELDRNLKTKNPKIWAFTGNFFFNI